MSVSQVPIRPIAKGSLLKFWLALAVLVGAAVLLAWAGTHPLRGETTASGVAFRTVTPGHGPTVGQQDVAMVEYVGTLDDGTVFDQTQGQAAPFTPMGVVAGFGEALQKMQAGGTYKFRLPPELGYGASPPQGIPANAGLNFEVKVREVVPGAGPILMQQMMGGGAGASR